MTCFMCKGDMAEQKTTFMVELDDTIIIVKNVPSLVCTQCGEVSYSHEVTKQLERIVQSAKSLATEIAVVKYKDAA